MNGQDYAASITLQIAHRPGRASEVQADWIRPRFLGVRFQAVFTLERRGAPDLARLEVGGTEGEREVLAIRMPLKRMREKGNRPAGVIGPCWQPGAGFGATGRFAFGAARGPDSRDLSRDSPAAGRFGDWFEIVDKCGT